jgi:DNA-binding transcriptional LysR family regulator
LQYQPLPITEKSRKNANIFKGFLAMSSILDLEIFVRVADSGSISAAARGLELTPAAASIALKRLETRLGIRLLARSTRSMRLTEVPRNCRCCAALRRAERFNAGGTADSAAAPARRLRQP